MIDVVARHRLDDDAEGHLAAFGMLFCGMGALWLTGYALVVARARGVMLRPRVRRALDAITGIALLGFGVRLAAERS